MQVFEMVVLIVAIGVIGGIISDYLKRKTVIEKAAMADGMGVDGQTKKKLDIYLRKFEDMEKRIQVLERIATDKGRDLANEIDSLK